MKADIFRNNEKAHVEGGIGDPGFSDNSLELQAAGVKVSGSEVEESSSEPSDADVRRKKLISQDNSINGDEGFFDVAAREINHLMLLCIEKKNVKKTNY
ncbi:hypothetical protein V6N11_050768 [Hibiscus sabdariffa]|uniref:Uncharacterized protein n=1 Tax=Hibiscus sabdariffa TaxID=183260 RepID=A0ABR2TBA2_9ROSI